jgi:HK97 family phage major capsid protein
MPDIADVLEDVKKEVKRFADEGGAGLKKLEDSIHKDLKAARDLAEEGKSDAQEVKKLAEAVSGRLEALVKQQSDADAKAKAAVDEQLDQIKALINRRPVIGAGGAGGEDEETKTRQDALELKRTRLALEGHLKKGRRVEVSDEEVEAYKAYHDTFLHAATQRDEKHLGSEEIKALTTGSDPDGGWLTVPAVSRQVRTTIRESSPMRQLATIETIGTDKFEVPIDDDDVGDGWVGEEELRPETTTPTGRTQVIEVMEQYAKPKATQRLIEDAVMSVENWLATKVADRFRRREASAFITGDGVKRPKGILSYPAGTARGYVQQVASGNAALLTPDVLVQVPFFLKEPYQANARWLMKRSTFAGIVLLKDNTNQYLFGPGLNGPAGFVLAGYPVSFADDMPAVVANSLSVAFGDFRAAYTIVDRLGITMLRDQYTAKPFVEFYFRRRVGGAVVQTEAYLLVKTSA